MVEGRCRQVFKAWLAQRPADWREALEVVAKDGTTGFETAAVDELSDAVAVMVPFRVVRLFADTPNQRPWPGNLGDC